MLNILLLISAALTYSVGGYFMKLSEGFTRGLPSLAVLALFCLGATLQMIAMRQSEMSTTYIVVLGMEAVTALALGMLLLGEGVTLVKLSGVALISLGVLALRS